MVLIHNLHSLTISNYWEVLGEGCEEAAAVCTVEVFSSLHTFVPFVQNQQSMLPLQPLDGHKLIFRVYD